MATTELEVDLHCNICTDLFVQPVTLICQHTFCQSCISDRNTRTCPMCRLAKFVPPEINTVIESMVKSIQGVELYECEVKRRVAALKEKNHEWDLTRKIEKEIWRSLVDMISQSSMIAVIPTNTQSDTTQSIGHRAKYIARTLFGDQLFTKVCMGITTATGIYFACTIHKYVKPLPQRSI